MNYSELPPINSKRWLLLEDFAGEVWKSVPGYEGFYEASNYGRVRSIFRRFRNKAGRLCDFHSQIIKVIITKSGYCSVSLSKEGNTRSHRLHKVVLESFCVRPFGKEQINHKDENKHNNCLTNLEFCTAKYNSNYGTKIERFRRKNTNNPKHSKSILQYTPEGKLVAEYPSIKEAWRMTGVDTRSISCACNGHHLTSCGYVWLFKGETFDDWKRRKRREPIRQIL